jgi:hypothetical protein
METAPRKNTDDPDAEDALSAFNADEILTDPDAVEPDEKSEPAATPDSPHPI